MENRNLLENLLNKYLNGNLTTSERRLFFELLATDSNENFFKEMILNHLSEFTHENSFDEKTVDFDSVYKSILSGIQVDTDRGTIKHMSAGRKVLLIAAAAAVMAAVFLLGRVSPASKNDRLAPVQQISYTEVKSPYGSRSEIKLPDGTEVILNAGSTLKYRNDFNMNNRDIILYGEGYFRVAKNISLPLVVNAGNIDIKAVGTEFNVKAYPEENTIETTLIEGKVEIANSNQEADDSRFIDLAPNQKAIFYKDEEEYKIENTIENEKPEPVKPMLDKILISPKADVEKTVAWTQGKLIFRGENLENLSIDLQRKYDVKIVFIDEDLKKFRFTGVLLDETLEQVMNVIKLTAPIGFNIEGKTVYLFTDPTEISGFEEYLK